MINIAHAFLQFVSAGDYTLVYNESIETVDWSVSGEVIFHRIQLARDKFGAYTNFNSSLPLNVCKFLNIIMSLTLWSQIIKRNFSRYAKSGLNLIVLFLVCVKKSHQEKSHLLYNSLFGTLW